MVLDQHDDLIVGHARPLGLLRLGKGLLRHFRHHLVRHFLDLLVGKGFLLFLFFVLFLRYLLLLRFFTDSSGIFVRLAGLGHISNIIDIITFFLFFLARVRFELSRFDFRLNLGQLLFFFFLGQLDKPVLCPLLGPFAESGRQLLAEDEVEQVEDSADGDVIDVVVEDEEHFFLYFEVFADIFLEPQAVL